MTSSTLTTCSHLEPGGWLELEVLDWKHYSQGDSAIDGNKVLESFDLESEAMIQLGRKLDVGKYL